MATAIRLGIDNALVASIATIPDLTHSGSSVPSIFLNPSRTVQESEMKPFAIIVTDIERKKKDNEYSVAEYMAEVSIWDIEDNSDVLYQKLVDYCAQVVAAVIPAGSLVRAAPGIYEIEENPSFAMDTLFFETGLGCAIVQFNIRYRHAYGNPYLANPV
jgi:hypothetical protein